MERVKEWILNGLLASLVLLSLGLSAQVWFPNDQAALARGREAQVQSPPPVQSESMPDIFRPERIYVREGQRVALIQAGTMAYAQIWRRVGVVLFGTGGSLVPVLIDPEKGAEAAEERSITLVLPMALTLAEWADRWNWQVTGLRYPHAKIDRVRFDTGQTSMLYLIDTAGVTYRLGEITSIDRTILNDVMALLDPELLRPYRLLQVSQPIPRVQPGLLVPDVTRIPVGELAVRPPDERTESARFFPDLSVVRQIDEREARSFTDGQRLVRLASSGILEFRAAHSQGAAPDLARALRATQEWMEQRGGWPQEVVLVGYQQTTGKTELLFDLRANGPYPIATRAGALLVQVSGDRVIYIRRLPEFQPAFRTELRPIISAEEALEAAANEFPRQLLFDQVREIHLSYDIRRDERTADRWLLEPVWVLQVGEARIRVPALVQPPQPLNGAIREAS